MSEKMNLPIITISREYYAGGRSVARKVSEALDIPWYDNDLAKLASKISGYSEDEVLNEGEEIGKLENIMEKLIGGANFYTSSHEEIHKAQVDAVLELSKEPCILVGRGANRILKEAGIPSFDVYLYADRNIRIKRTMDDKNIDESSAKKFLEKHDSLRELYYKKYIGDSYEKMQDYTICFDTGVIDYDMCAQIIADVFKNRKDS